jgi:hypothetical protein
MVASILFRKKGLSVFFLTPTSRARSTREQALIFSPLRHPVRFFAGAGSLALRGAFQILKLDFLY